MKVHFFLGVLIVAGAAADCGGISNPNDIVFPADSVSYAMQVRPYLTLACESSGCHNASDEAGGVDLSSFTSIRDGTIPVVVPRDTTTSLLYKVLFGEQQHAATILANANQRQGIAKWIMEGAPDN